MLSLMMSAAAAACSKRQQNEHTLGRGSNMDLSYAGPNEGVSNNMANDRLSKKERAPLLTHSQLDTSHMYDADQRPTSDTL